MSNLPGSYGRADDPRAMQAAQRAHDEAVPDEHDGYGEDEHSKCHNCKRRGWACAGTDCVSAFDAALDVHTANAKHDISAERR